MSRPTPEEIEDIRANDCGHPECYECGARMKLLAEVDALRQERDGLARAAGGAVDLNVKWAARVRELEAERDGYNQLQGEWRNRAEDAESRVQESQIALGRIYGIALNDGRVSKEPHADLGLITDVARAALAPTQRST